MSRIEGLGRSDRALVVVELRSDRSYGVWGHPAGLIFLTSLGTLGRCFFDDFGTFGSGGASGRVGTIGWDRGIRRTRAPERSGASVGTAENDETGFSASSTIRGPERKFIWLLNVNKKNMFFLKLNKK